MVKPFILVIFIIGAFLGGAYLSKPTSCGAACATQVKSVDSSEFHLAVSASDIIIIDVRTPEEFAAGHIKNAVNSDFYNKSQFDQFLNSLDKNKKYLIYCRSGNRSGQTLKLMEEKGFTNVTNLSGGIISWSEANLPLEK